MPDSPSLSDLLAAREHFAERMTAETFDQNKRAMQGRMLHCDRLIDQAIGYPARQDAQDSTAAPPEGDQPRPHQNAPQRRTQPPRREP